MKPPTRIVLVELEEKGFHSLLRPTKVSQNWV